MTTIDMSEPDHQILAALLLGITDAWKETREAPQAVTIGKLDTGEIFFADDPTAFEPEFVASLVEHRPVWMAVVAPTWVPANPFSEPGLLPETEEEATAAGWFRAATVIVAHRETSRVVWMSMPPTVTDNGDVLFDEPGLYGLWDPGNEQLPSMSEQVADVVEMLAAMVIA